MRHARPPAAPEASIPSESQISSADLDAEAVQALEELKSTKLAGIESIELVTVEHGSAAFAICDYAGKHGVFLALENHGGLTATVDGMLKLIRDVKSPWFGVNLDSGNFHGEDLYGDLAKIAPYALNCQIKVVVSGPDRKKTPSDFPRLAKILTAAGYRGYIVLEYEEDEDPRVACPRHLDELRAAFA